MKLKLIYSAIAIASVCTFSACKDDDELPVAGIEFDIEEQEVSESDGTFTSFNPEIQGAEDGEGRIINVDLKFDRPLADNVVLKFDVDGTARQTSSTNEVKDFMIAEEGTNLTVDDDEVTILKGSESASFSVIVFEDLRYEYDDEGEFNEDNIPYESIEIELESVVSGPGKLGEQLTHTLKVLEDDLYVVLLWDAQDYADENEASAEVDMDLIVWFEDLVWPYGANRDKQFEITFIPAGLGEGNVDFSYTYYAGLSNDLNFEVGYFSAAGTIEGEQYIDEPIVFQGNYNLANVHAWTEESLPLTAQTATKDGIDYDNFSPLEDFAQSSRTKKRLLPTTLSKEMRTKVSKASLGYRSLIRR